MSAETVTASPTQRLAGYRPPSTRRRRDTGSRSRFGGSAADWLGLAVAAHLEQYPRAAHRVNTSRVNALPRSSGVQLHLTSLPGRPPRPRGLPVRRLAGRRRAVVVAGAAARAARPPPLAVQGALGVRGLAGLLADRARAGVARRRSPSSASATRTGSATGSGSPAAARVADQVRFEREWAALRAYARRARRADARRRRDLRRARERRPPRPSRAVPGRARRRARRRTRSRAPGQLWGNPLYDWPALQPPRLPLVGRAPAAHARAVRPRADRPLPRLRRLLGGARPGARDRGRRALAARARAGRVFDAIARELGRAAARRRGPRRDHPGRSSGCATSSACPGCSCSSSASTPTTRAARTGSTTTSRTGSSTPAPTTTTPRAAGTSRSTPARARARRRGARARAASPSAEPWWGADPAGARLAGAGGDGPGPGRARARQRGADERPRRGPAGAGAGRWSAAALTPALARAAARGDRGGGRSAAVSAPASRATPRAAAPAASTLAWR